MKNQSNNNLPKGWRKVKLGEVVKVKRGASPRPIMKFLGGNIPWVKISDATGISSRFINNTKEKIIKEGKKKSIFLPKGSLILANSGQVGFPKLLGVDGCIHDGWLWFSDYNGIDKMFLFYYLEFKKNLLKNIADGSTQKNLNTFILENLKIIIPEDINQQKRIADILSAFDERIELNNRINQILEEMAQAIFKEWFVAPNMIGNINKKWQILNAQEVLVFEKGIEPGSRYYSEKRKDGYIPFYRVRDLDKVTGVDVYIPEEIAQGKTCKENDVLLSLDATIGRVKIGCNGAFSSGIRKVYSKDGFIKNSFIYFWLKTPYVQNTILEHASGTTILHAGRSIKYLKFPFNKEVIQKIQTKVDPIFEKILHILKENQKLSALRDLLLPKLMSGEVRV